MSVNRFFAEILIIVGNPYVRPPDQVLNSIFAKAKRDKGPIPVKGKINNAPFRQTLVRYQGDWRLYINGVMAKKANLKYKKSISEIVGIKVDIELHYDPKPPVIEMTPFLKEALDNNPIAKRNFENLIPSRKREILRYFSWLQSDEAKKRNLEKLLRVLSGKKSRFMARIGRKASE